MPRVGDRVAAPRRLLQRDAPRATCGAERLLGAGGAQAAAAVAASRAARLRRRALRHALVRRIVRQRAPHRDDASGLGRFLLEGCKVLHRVGLALLRIAEPRLLACHDQQELLCALQEEHAQCLDVERLLSVAFDKFSFLRSFPRSRIDALRRKHRARLRAAEREDAEDAGMAAPASPMASPSPPAPASPAGAGKGGGEGSSGGGDGSSISGGGGSGSGATTAATIGAGIRRRPRQIELYGDDHAKSSSDEEDGDDVVGAGDGGFDVVSAVDDVKESSGSTTFWL